MQAVSASSNPRIPYPVLGAFGVMTDVLMPMNFA